MSSPPSLCQSTSRARYTARRDANSVTPPPSIYEYSTTSELKPTPEQNHSLTWPTTPNISSEDSLGTFPTPSKFCDGGTFDKGSSVTLQDEFPWHEVGANKSTNKIPSTIAPSLLQLRTYEAAFLKLFLSGDVDRGGPREVDEDSRGSGDDVPRYSTSQKENWKAGTESNDTRRSDLVRSPSPRFEFQSPHNSAGDWAVHNRPILQDYADRQPSLPLGRRLEVTIDEPPQFILGAVQLLVNRDSKDCADPSRRLGPQLIENFVDIDRWARDYFRSRHGTQLVDGDVAALLTIVMNNFYEGQVQLIDRLVEFALEHMRFCGRRNLHLEDFSFGFDFRMSQDLPFYVETSSRIRKALPIPTVEVGPITLPMTTNSGRQVKPTERAQAASEQASGRRNKRKNTLDKQVVKTSIAPACQKKDSVQSSSQHTGETVISQDKPLSPPKTASERMKCRAMRSSNLKLPPILPSPSSIVEALHLGDIPKSESSTSASADSPKVSAPSGPNVAVTAPPRLTIMVPPLRIPPPTGSAANSSLQTDSTKKNGLTPLDQPSNKQETTTMRRGVRPVVARPRGPRNGRGRGHGRECGCTSKNLNPDSEAPETTPVNTKVLSRVHAVDVSNTKASEAAAVNPPGRSSTVVDAKKTVGVTTKAWPCGVDNAIGNRNNGRSSRTSSRTRAGQALPKTDPSHPRRKKRKLDDCDD